MNNLTFNPPIIAHRGASHDAPENTLAAFVKAAQLGAKWVEFDVMLSSDGVPVVFHDESLIRTTGVAGELKNYPYAFLSQLDVGSWFNQKFAGERLPSLHAVLAFLKEMQLSANIELKARPHQENQLVDQVAHEVNQFEFSAQQILYSSFSLNTLFLLREKCKGCYIGVLLDQWLENLDKLANDLNCASIHVDYKILDEVKVKYIKNLNKKLLCYTVNSKTLAQKLFDWGVDAVFTDRVDIMLSS